VEGRCSQFACEDFALTRFEPASHRGGELDVGQRSLARVDERDQTDRGVFGLSVG
jgi:hypothetical protein